MMPTREGAQADTICVCILIGKGMGSKPSGFSFESKQACQTKGGDFVNVVKFELNDYAKCVSSFDFYKAIGLFDLMKAGTIKSVYQMKINPSTYNAIETQMKSNWKRSRQTRSLREDKAHSIISFD